MSSRGRPKASEFHFGNESFLDVIANIVGILIILIVVAGLRVRSAPAVVQADPGVEREASAAREAWARDKSRIETDNQQRRAKYDTALEERLAAIARRNAERSAAEKLRAAAADERREAISAREALLRTYRAEAAELAGEVALMSRDLADAEAAGQRGQETRERFRKAAADQRTKARQIEPLVADEETRVQEQQAESAQLAAALDAIRKETEALKQTPLPTKEWKHYAAPVARKVTGKEVHFRCLGGRIADTHLQELLDRIVNRIASRPIHREPAMEGTVGPIDGFRMRYELRKVDATMVEQLSDPFAGRIDLRGFEIVAESDQLGEPADAALAEGSRLAAALAGKPTGEYTVTLWVYPDSFAMVQPIQMHLHQRGYTVALRPMLIGTLISGSPWGSASHGY